MSRGISIRYLNAVPLGEEMYSAVCACVYVWNKDGWSDT